MKIIQVGVAYGELRSNGYPDFGNKKYGVTYTAMLDEGDDHAECRRLLMERAVRDVRLLHGDELQKADIKYRLIETQNVAKTVIESVENELPF